MCISCDTFCALIGGSHDVEQVQRGGDSDNIVQQVVIVEALPPLKLRLQQLRPAEQQQSLFQGH
jgi:hypothetical protein